MDDFYCGSLGYEQSINITCYKNQQLTLTKIIHFIAHVIFLNIEWFVYEEFDKWMGSLAPWK